MMFKRFFISLFLMVSVCMPITDCFAVAPHTIIDMPQNTQVSKDLVQMILAYKQVMETVREMQDMNASIGRLKSAPGRLFRSLKKGLKDESAQFVHSYFGKRLTKIEMNKVHKNAKEVRDLVRDKVFPKEGTMTSAEAAERRALRKEAREDAISDAYAVSLAYMAESTKAEQEKIEPAKNTVEVKNTLKEKQDAANEIAVARLKEQIEGNRLMSLQLRLQAANSMADLGAYKDVDS